MVGYIEELRNYKALVAEFQTEVKSNSVIEFCVWIENRISLINRDKDERRKYRSDNNL